VCIEFFSKIITTLTHIMSSNNLEPAATLTTTTVTSTATDAQECPFSALQVQRSVTAAEYDKEIEYMSHLNASEWTYLNEGGLNLVFAYIGSQHPNPESDTKQRDRVMCTSATTTSDCTRPCDLATMVTDQHSVMVGQVIRLNKEVLSASSASTVQDHFQMFADRLEYSRSLMRPLIGEHFVDAGRIVFVQHTFVATLINQFNSYRPTKRRKVHSLENTICDEWIPAVMMTDYTSIVPPPIAQHDAHRPRRFTISVEIKPKWGFLPSKCAPISDQTHIKRAVCRFCMNQVFKLHRGKASVRSSYCPMDLFSGQASRIKRALEALFSCPQNNLRVYIRSHKDLTAKQVDPMQPHEYSSALQSITGQVYTGHAGDILAQKHLQSIVLQVLLKHSPLLDRLAFIQQWFDSYDVEGTYPLFCQLCEEITRACLTGDGDDDDDTVVRTVCDSIDQSLSHKTMDSLQRKFKDAYASRQQQKLQQASSHCYGQTLLCGDTNAIDISDSLCAALTRGATVAMASRKEMAVDSKLCKPEATAQLSKFLVAATAKDTSLMLTVEHATESTRSTTIDNSLCGFPVHGARLDVPISSCVSVPIQYRVAVTDLDPKSAHRIPKYYREDCTIVQQFCAKVLDTLKPSVS
jgi:Inositol-pentakisphosphate 2-kinase